MDICAGKTCTDVTVLSFSLCLNAGPKKRNNAVVRREPYTALVPFNAFRGLVGWFAPTHTVRTRNHRLDDLFLLRNGYVTVIYFGEAYLPLLNFP